jgi:hypothetical protein
MAIDDQIKQESRDRRNLYVKPEVKRVDLRPEHAVLGTCKITGASGPGAGGSCRPAGSPCSTQGS